MLSLYFLLVVKFGMSEERIARQVEPFMHLFAFGYPFVAAIYALVNDMYAEFDIGPGCWINDKVYAGIFAGYTVLLIILMIVVNNLLIYLHVRNTFRTVAGRTLTDSTKRVRAVAVQAFLYVGAFLACFSWSVVIRYTDNRYDDSKEAELFPILVLQAILYPLQGFFSIFIYCRPKFLRFATSSPTNHACGASKGLCMETG